MSVLSKQSVAAAASTSLFVLLWSSGAIFSKLGLAHASPFAFLLIRFAIALAGLVVLVPILKLRLPRPGKPLWYAVATGLVLLGAYQIFYLLALDLKITPGVMATIMGVQPILTVVLMERQRSWRRIFGLALASMTLGSIMQKRITENPLGTLPVQYLAGLLLCVVFVPFQPFHFEHSSRFYLPVLWMGLVVSLLATLLLYRLIARGNLVNVTSLFYLVPAVTAVMDYLIFGNRLALLSVLGMGLIIVGLVFVFRKA